MYKTNQPVKSQSNITLRDYLHTHSRIKKMRSTTSINSQKTDLPENIFKRKISQIKMLLKQKIKEERVFSLLERKINELLEFYLQSAKSVSNLPEVQEEEQEGNKNKLETPEEKTLLVPLPKIRRRISLKTDLTDSHQKNLNSSYAPSKFYQEQHDNSLINVEIEQSQSLKSSVKENSQLNGKTKKQKVEQKKGDFENTEEGDDLQDLTAFFKKKKTTGKLTLTHRISQKPPKLEKDMF